MKYRLIHIGKSGGTTLKYLFHFYKNLYSFDNLEIKHKF